MVLAKGVVGIEYDGITNGVAKEVEHLSFGDGVEYVPLVESSGVTGLLGLDGGWVGGVESAADEGVELRPRLFVGLLLGHAEGFGTCEKFLTTGLEPGSCFFPRTVVVAVAVNQLWKSLFFRRPWFGRWPDEFFVRE